MPLLQRMIQLLGIYDEALRDCVKCPDHRICIPGIQERFLKTSGFRGFVACQFSPNPANRTPITLFTQSLRKAGKQEFPELGAHFPVFLRRLSHATG